MSLFASEDRSDNGSGNIIYLRPQHGERSKEEGGGSCGMHLLDSSEVVDFVKVRQNQSNMVAVQTLTSKVHPSIFNIFEKDPNQTNQLSRVSEFLTTTSLDIESALYVLNELPRGLSWWNKSESMKIIEQSIEEMDNTSFARTVSQASLNLDVIIIWKILKGQKLKIGPRDFNTVMSIIYDVVNKSGSINPEEKRAIYVYLGSLLAEKTQFESLEQKIEVTSNIFGANPYALGYFFKLLDQVESLDAGAFTSFARAIKKPVFQDIVYQEGKSFELGDFATRLNRESRTSTPPKVSIMLIYWAYDKLRLGNVSASEFLSSYEFTAQIVSGSTVDRMDKADLLDFFYRLHLKKMGISTSFSTDRTSPYLRWVVKYIENSGLRAEKIHRHLSSLEKISDIDILFALENFPNNTEDWGWEATTNNVLNDFINQELGVSYKQGSKKIRCPLGRGALYSWFRKPIVRTGAIDIDHIEDLILRIIKQSNTQNDMSSGYVSDLSRALVSQFKKSLQ